MKKMAMLIGCNLQLKVDEQAAGDDDGRESKQGISKTRPILIWLSIVLCFKQNFQIGGTQSSPRTVGFQAEIGAIDLELLKSVHPVINRVQSFNERGGFFEKKKKRRRFKRE